MDTPDPLPHLIRALEDESAYDHPVDSIELVETHISWVLLTGPFAYKIKKPVSFAFVDFSTLERRRRFCDEELRLNRRLAPAIYLGVVPIGGSTERPVVGATPAIEYAVKMRQFAPDARLDRMLARGEIAPDDLRTFATTLGEFHLALEPAARDSRLGSLALVVQGALGNLRELEQVASENDATALAAIRRWTEARCVTLTEAFARRKREGAIRECHGDLHLENLVYLEDAVAAFDALEFDPELRWVDVMSETAFLVMDLAAHGRADLAYPFLSRYLEVTGDYEGLEVLPFYVVYRALVRAKVRALREKQAPASTSGSDGPGYIEQARAICTCRRPLLLITRGLSGSGKTTVTDGLIGPLRAVRARSDLERKRLHGVAATADTGSPVGAGLYDSGASAKTYAALERCAQRGLAAGFDMIVDAAFLERARRDAFHALADRAGARFAILDCVAPRNVLEQRVTKRKALGADASEAGTAVLAHQLATHEPLTSEETALAVRVDTSTPLDAAALAERIATRDD